MSRPNTVFVGRKPVLNYVLACITLFRGDAEEVVVKARGRAISRAVDVVEVIRNRFMPDVKVKEIKIGTEEITSEEENRTTNVSTIEIVLTR
ncbi:DNA-binding protein Alba [Candidatus Bathyarchaeota archaeon]|nr:DNA-binding protein Alba [Candidatus Bathyarchaeota archaeon]RJS89470.1 MAG: DNA-binding protein Alba [Candidatus Bathyarchaeota archaeon]